MTESRPSSASTPDSAIRDRFSAGSERATGILQSITDGYHVVDAQGRFTEINAAARAMFSKQGIDPQTLLGKRIFDEVVQEARQTEAATAFEKTLAERVPTTVEHFYEPWQRWHFVRHFPTPDGGVATFFLDFTERKQLSAAHDTFRHLVENAPFGLYAVDADFRLVQVSAGAQKVFQHVRPLIGRDFTEVMRQLWQEPFVSEALALFRHTLETGEPYHSSSTIERRQDIGEVEAYDWKLERVMLPDGRFGVVCHFYDLSERQAAEARALFLSQLSQKLAMVNDAEEIQSIAMRELGEFLNVHRCYFLEVSPDARQVAVIAEWRRDGVDLVGSYRMRDFGEDEWWQTTARQPLGINDVQTHAWTQAFADKYPPLNVRAYALAPFVHDGRWVASIGASSDQVRQWTAEDLALLDNVIARVWPLIERARSESARRESETRLQLALDASEMGTFIWNVTEDRAEPDERFLLLFGVAPDGFINHKTALTELVHPDDVAPYAAAVARAVDPHGDGILRVEVRVVLPDGNIRWLSITGQTHFDDPNGIIRMAGAGMNITERKRAEEELRESEARFRNMANNAPVMVWITEPDGTCSFLSESWYEFTGQTPETGLGFGWIQATHPDDHQLAHDTFINANENRGPFHVEYRLLRRDGQYRWAIDAAMPRFDSKGQFLGYIGSVIDITDRKLAEEALQASDRRKTAMIELSDRLRELSDPADLAFSAAELLGQTLNVSRCGYGTIDKAKEIITIERDWNAPGIKSLAGVLHFRDYGSYIEDLKRGEAVIIADAEKDPRSAAGAAALKAISAQAVVNLPVTEQGGLVALLYLNHAEAREWTDEEMGFIREVAERTRIAVERRRTEQALRVSHEKAEIASRAKDDFLAALSHELRTPLNPVLMVASELAQDETLPEKVRADLRMIQRNIGLEARLIDDLLDLTRISRGMLQMHMETVDAHSLLRHTEEIVSADLAGRTLEVRLQFDAKESFVLADPARLQQVFWNLLKNSVKFTPDGGRITLCTSNPEPGRLSISVVDTGRGIQTEALERIFDSFDQGDLSGRHAFGGLGLGLSISKALMDMHNGRLEATSPGQDQGATFTVELATTAPRPARVKPGTESANEVPGLRLMIVEDDVTSLTVLVQLLRRRGHEVHAAFSVATALALAASQTFNLVISDLGLPDGTGLDLMREIKARYGWPGIALSGFGMESDIQQSLAAGFAMHLVKPVSSSDLHRAILALQKPAAE